MEAIVAVIKLRVVLSDRERVFVGHIANGMAPSPAARSAGFAISYGRRLLEQDHIRAALAGLSNNAIRALADTVVR